MPYSLSTRVLFLIIVLGVTLSGCKDNPSGPNNELPPVSISGGKFHGTWVSVYSPTDSARISFDSTSMRFLDQYVYEFGIHREFPGTFSVKDSTVYLRYDYDEYEYAAFSYSLTSNTISLGDTLNHRILRRLVRISTVPSYDGWSPKLEIQADYTFSDVQASVLSYCSSDSGLIVLVTMDNDRQRYLLRLDTVARNTYWSAPSVSAIDARGPYLWTATDSSVDRRTISNPTVLSSFDYRSTAGPGFQATGLAVDSAFCFLMIANYSIGQGKLLKFGLNGNLLGSVQTNSVIRDLCLINGRLFCLDGDETFFVLNTNTGRVIANYNIRGRPFGNNIEGIALISNMIQFASRGPGGFLRLTNVKIP